MLKIPILCVTNANNFEDFVNSWRKFYNRSNDYKYAPIESESPLTPESLLSIFEWKNGMPLSKLKLNSIANLGLKIELINQLRSSFDVVTFEREFGHMSFVWRKFLMHAIQPSLFPIYDQHSHRAVDFLLSEQNPRESEAFYVNKFVTYIEAWKGNQNYKHVDEALFEFGKFIRSPQARNLLVLNIATKSHLS